jgi:hypothetical protein
MFGNRKKTPEVWTRRLTDEFRRATRDSIEKKDFNHVSRKFGGPQASDAQGKLNPLWESWFVATSQKVMEFEIGTANNVTVIQDDAEGLQVRADGLEYMAINDINKEQVTWLRNLIQPKLKQG